MMNRFKRKALRVGYLAFYLFLLDAIYTYILIINPTICDGSFCQVIADFLSNEEVEDIKETFKKIDTDDDGIVTIEELKTGLQKLNTQLAESEVQLLIEAVSWISFLLFIYFSC